LALDDEQDVAESSMPARVPAGRVWPSLAGSVEVTSTRWVGRTTLTTAPGRRRRCHDGPSIRLGTGSLCSRASPGHRPDTDLAGHRRCWPGCSAGSPLRRRCSAPPLRRQAADRPDELGYEVGHRVRVHLGGGPAVRGGRPASPPRGPPSKGPLLVVSNEQMVYPHLQIGSCVSHRALRLTLASRADTARRGATGGARRTGRGPARRAAVAHRRAREVPFRQGRQTHQLEQFPRPLVTLGDRGPAHLEGKTDVLQGVHVSGRGCRLKDHPQDAPVRGTSVMSSPPTNTLPSSSRSSPATARRAVVLPSQTGPAGQTSSPGAMEMENPSRRGLAERAPAVLQFDADPPAGVRSPAVPR